MSKRIGCVDGAGIFLAAGPIVDGCRAIRLDVASATGSVLLSPSDARQLAAELLERAQGIDGQAGEPANRFDRWNLED